MITCSDPGTSAMKLLGCQKVCRKFDDLGRKTVLGKVPSNLWPNFKKSAYQWTCGKVWCWLAKM